MYDLSHFQKEGFQVLSNLIPLATLDEVGAFLQEEATQTVQELLTYFGMDEEAQLSPHIVSLSKEETFQTLPRELQLKLSGHFSLETRLSPNLLKIAKLPQIRELFQEIFPEEKPHLHMPPTARFVLPHNSFAGVPPHQDVNYNQHVKDFFVLWVPLNPITESRGGVQVFKGTNQQKTFPLAEQTDFWLPGVEVADAEMIHCLMQPGDALILNKWIVHASMPNLSNTVRISTDFRFFYGASEKHYYDFETDRIVAPEDVCAAPLTQLPLKN